MMNLEICLYIDSTWYGIKDLNKPQGFKFQPIEELITPNIMVKLIDKLLLENYMLYDFKYGKEIKLYFKKDNNSIVVTIKKLNKNNNLNSYIDILIANYQDILLNTNYIKELINKNKQELFRKEVNEMLREKILNLINNLSDEELKELVNDGYNLFNIYEEDTDLARILKIGL